MAVKQCILSLDDDDDDDNVNDVDDYVRILFPTSTWFVANN